MKIRNQALGLAMFFALATGTAFASPSQRGLQVDLGSMTSEIVDDLSETWGVNLVRIQIGDNARMDGLVGDDYLDMMRERMDLLDQKLPFFAANNIKVVFALYSPPGGFETREAPSHYLMFSQAALQTQLIAMWEEIAERYKDNANIYAFDLLNEPAMRQSMLGAGAKNWNQLLPDLIQAVRAKAPNSKIIVKSLYGDPSKLSALPALNYSNLIYSYHAYPFLEYQHSGIDNLAFSQTRPSATQVEKKLLKLLGGFYAKQMARYNAGEISQFPPELNVGEAAISACATEGGEFLDSLLNVLEKEGDNAALLKFAAKYTAKAKKKRAKRRLPPLKKPASADFAKWITHTSYTIHAFAEADVWDPRNVCDSSGVISRSDSTTDRGEVLQSYFSRN
ncbi:MAG: cellulase family glycosylhydrolase [Deltaproteobacteria bacterium]|nr:cellulase family glycosylhydrolase [Deltaproteobacteria bacterium]